MYSENEGKTKLDWMYKGANSAVDREEYLLGRKIDKTLEQLNDEEKHKELGVVQPKNHVEHECIPPSIRDYKLQVGEQVDLATKLQEDPLVLIRKREEESRRQFLQNPILLKKLQATLLKRTKTKKKKKRGRSGAASEAEIDMKIAEKLDLLKGGSLKSHEDNEDLDFVLLQKLAKLKNRLSHDEIQEIIECTKSAPSSASEEENISDDSDYKARSRMRNSGGRRRRRGCSPGADCVDRPIKHSLRDDGNRRRGGGRLTDEEKERRRREMMENASWRDEERTRNVRRYREEESREIASTGGKYTADFIHKELLKSANSGSVESRIKANINGIQRDRNDMNTHFTRRH